MRLDAVNTKGIARMAEKDLQPSILNCLRIPPTLPEITSESPDSIIIKL